MLFVCLQSSRLRVCAFVCVCVLTTACLWKLTGIIYSPQSVVTRRFSFDSSESDIQIWHANVNEPRVLMTSHFHLPHPNQPFPLGLWPRYGQIGLINLIPRSGDGWALLPILKHSRGEQWGKKRLKTNSLNLLSRLISERKEVKGNQIAPRAGKIHILELVRDNKKVHINALCRIIVYTVQAPVYAHCPLY